MYNIPYVNKIAYATLLHFGGESYRLIGMNILNLSEQVKLFLWARFPSTIDMRTALDCPDYKQTHFDVHTLS